MHVTEYILNDNISTDLWGIGDFFSFFINTVWSTFPLLPANSNCSSSGYHLYQKISPKWMKFDAKPEIFLQIQMFFVFFFLRIADAEAK